MNRWIAAALGIALLAFLFVAGSLHGHGDHRLFVRVCLVDAATGEPVRDAVVLVARYEIDESRYEFERAQALRYLDDPERSALLDGEVLVTPLPICAGRTDADGATELWASRYHTVYTNFFVFTHREDGGLPRHLVVEHPDYERVLQLIDQRTPVESAGSKWKSRIDLGTISVARRRPSSAGTSTRK